MKVVTHRCGIRSWEL